MMKVLLKLFFTILLFGSCKTEDYNSEKYISNEVSKLLSLKNNCYKNIIILPSTGCSGCITVAEDFFSNNYSNKEYLFVLTNIRSLKLLKNKTGIEVKNKENIYIDKKNIFSNYENPIYPVVILNNCKKNKIENIYFQKPGNNAFGKI